jgi:hypothetical protein
MEVRLNRGADDSVTLMPISFPIPTVTRRRASGETTVKSAAGEVCRKKRVNAEVIASFIV